MTVVFKMFISAFLLLTIPLESSAQNNTADYTLEGDLRYTDYIYQEGILTVQFHPVSNDLAMPIIPLGGGTQLLLSFDDLYEDYANYSYTIIHCNENWKPSDLMTSDYLSNFQNFDIQDFTYSINALIPYTHYQVRIPNENVNFTKSGNYLLVVYRDDDPENRVLSRRFMVYENRVNIGGRVKRATPVELMNTHQEVDFTIFHPNFEIPYPTRDLHVHLFQNQRWDNTNTTLKPRFIREGALVYQQDRENTFAGGNEYRFFDLKTLLNLGQNVVNVERNDYFTAYLRNEYPRSENEYSVLFDVNGRYRIRRLDAENSATTADYVYVDFILKTDQANADSDVYVFGKLSDWQLKPRFKLQYNEARGAYQSQILLKQGFYNYMFATRAPNKPMAVLKTYEGAYWETENTYQILVYHRDVGTRYDRLVGYAELSSDELYSQ